MAWAKRRTAPPRIRGREAAERRARVLARQPICAMCCRAPSTIADHILNLAHGGQDDERNLQGLCDPCHKRKTQVEAAQGVLRNARAGTSGTRPTWL